MQTAPPVRCEDRPAVAVDVPAALGARKNGTTEAECRRVARTLARLQPAASAAMRQSPPGGEGPTPDAGLARTLEDLAGD